MLCVAEKNVNRTKYQVDIAAQQFPLSVRAH